jgi:hypothetical protein
LRYSPLTNCFFSIQSPSSASVGPFRSFRDTAERHIPSLPGKTDYPTEVAVSKVLANRVCRGEAVHRGLA